MRLPVPQDVAALILIAPAIMARPAAASPSASAQRSLSPTLASSAPPAVPSAPSSATPFDNSLSTPLISTPAVALTAGVLNSEQPGSSPPSAPSQGTHADSSSGSGGSNGMATAAALVKSLLQGLALASLLLMLRVCKPLIVLSLRAAVRSRAFWVSGLGKAYYTPSLLTDDVVDAYR